jgi:hypothetical protein
MGCFTPEALPVLSGLAPRDAAAPGLGDVLTLSAPRTGDPLAG